MSRVSVHVRSAEPSDTEAMARLLASAELPMSGFGGRRGFDRDPQQLASRIAGALAQHQRYFVVAVEDTSDEVVGVLVAKRDEIGALDLSPVLHVTHLIVAPGHRRRGVGRMLLGAAVQLCDEHGSDWVLATASAGSRESNRYLARIGFAPLVLQRVAPTSVLRRSLGVAETPDRLSVMRRARRGRGINTTLAARVVRRGA